jgi:glycosyltransferase involved in cell wall biosynthesis
MVQSFVELGTPNDRVSFIPLGIEVSTGPDEPSRIEHPTHKVFRSTDAFRIVYVGSLIPRKSVDTLLEAHRLLERRGHKVATLVVGSGPSEQELRALVASGGLEHVYLVGEQPPAHIGAWIYPAHVLVLPSRSEGRGLVLLEAMALGRPVIASDIPGPRELVHEGRTGFLFPPGDAASLAARLEELIRDPALRDRLGQAGRDLINAEGLTVRQSALRHIELYYNLARGYPKGRHKAP